MSTPLPDAAIALGLVGAFAVLVTVHVATLYGLLRRRHFTDALGALVLPPIAPYLAFTRGMRARAALWLAGAALYVTAFLLARR